MVRSFGRGSSVEAFTLTEVILAASIVGLIVMLMVNILPGAMLGVRKVEHRIRADAIAHGILEEKRAGPFGALDAAPATTRLTDGDGTEYAVQYSVLTRTGADPDKLKGMRVTVSWQERLIGLSVTREMWLCNIPR